MLATPRGLSAERYVKELKSLYREKYPHLPAETVNGTIGWITGSADVALTRNSKPLQVAHYLSIIDTLTPEEAEKVYEELSPHGARSAITNLFEGIQSLQDLQGLTDVVTCQMKIDFDPALNEQYYVFLKDAVIYCCKEFGEANKAKPATTVGTQTVITSLSATLQPATVSRSNTGHSFPTKNPVSKAPKAQPAQKPSISKVGLPSIQEREENKENSENLFEDKENAPTLRESTDSQKTSKTQQRQPLQKKTNQQTELLPYKSLNFSSSASPSIQPSKATLPAPQATPKGENKTNSPNNGGGHK